MWPTLDEIRFARDAGTGRGVRVAILDSGIDEAHPTLEAARFQPSQAVRTREQGPPVVEPCEPADLHGHGTAIAGIVHSLAPDAELLSIRVLESGLIQNRHEVFRQGALRAIAMDAHILNCSFGSPGTPARLPLYKSWTDFAFHHDRHLVVAASNADPDALHWPASFSQVLSVTAEDLGAAELRFRPERLVSFAAAGLDITVLSPGGETRMRTGSSFAAAHLSGLLARILSRYPGLSPMFAHEALRRLAEEDSAESGAAPDSTD